MHVERKTYGEKSMDSCIRENIARLKKEVETINTFREKLERSFNKLNEKYSKLLYNFSHEVINPNNDDHMSTLLQDIERQLNICSARLHELQVMLVQDEERIQVLLKEQEMPNEIDMLKRALAQKNIEIQNLNDELKQNQTKQKKACSILENFENKISENEKRTRNSEYWSDVP